MRALAPRVLALRLSCAVLIGAAWPATAAPAGQASNVAVHRKDGRATHSLPSSASGAMKRAPLSYSDEFERAEMIEEMLKECRGVAYNAYELAQSTGEALWLPAPIQLLTVRVKHPYCATLLRAYAPKTAV
jgi:hypothetical protein